MSSLVFIHQMADALLNPRRTIAIDGIDKSAVQMILQQMLLRSTPLTYRAKIGIAKVHPKDRYSRKEGRKVAASRMEDVGLDVDLVIVGEKALQIQMSNKKLNLHLTVVQYKDSKKIRIIG